MIDLDSRSVAGRLKMLSRSIHSKRTLVDELGVVQVGIGKLRLQL